MSLRVIHVLFITISSLLALGIGLWALDAGAAWQSTGWQIFGALSLLSSAGLVVYGVRFVRHCRNAGIE